ncbi:MAG: DUF4962 domain-containing protein [Tepidisphaeraceae bacterium]
MNRRRFLKLHIAGLLVAAAACLAADPHLDRLDQIKAIHPRLYLNQQRFEDLKRKTSDEPYRRLLAQVVAVADGGVRSGPPKYIEHDNYSGDEQLWQRSVGNMIPHLAMAYRLTGERKYLQAASDWMVASAGYRTWGLGNIDGKDLAAGHQLYGMALGYDWLYDNLDPQTRLIIQKCLETRGRFMFEQLSAGKIWWGKSYLQNHQWVNLTGLAAAGMALYGQTPDVEGWIRLPLEKYRTVMVSLGPDGASHEGVPYWSYGVEYMLKFMDLARDLLGEEMFKDNAWFRHTADFRLYSMLPRGGWSRRASLMTFADGPRYDWYGPDYLLRKLAAEYRDGHAQWLANELDHAQLCSTEASFLNLIWVDPALKAVSPADLPTFKHFEDMGLVFMRSGWDGQESLLAFKCGPTLGHDALKRYSYDPGSGHVHPDAGAIQLFAHGDWLIVDDGYSAKHTEYQNTVTVNGIGQTGEGKAWFDSTRLLKEKRGAKILYARPGKEFDYVIGDVAPAYEPAAGLARFVRHVVYWRPDIWVLIDELATREPAEFTLFFHADEPFQGAGGGNVFDVKGRNGALRLVALAPESAVAKCFKQDIVSTGGKTGDKLDVLALSNGSKQDKAMFVTVLSAYKAVDKPDMDATLTHTSSAPILTLRYGDRTFRLALHPDRSDPSGPIIEAVR